MIQLHLVYLLECLAGHDLFTPMPEHELPQLPPSDLQALSKAVEFYHD